MQEETLLIEKFKVKKDNQKDEKKNEKP